MKKVYIQGKHKLADLWEAGPYIIRSQPEMPVLRVEKENSTGKYTHRNMLLPFHGLPSHFSEASTPRKTTTTPAPDDSKFEDSDKST